MGGDYQAISWNRFKRVYDFFIILGIMVYIGTFVFISINSHIQPSDINLEIVLIRALGTCALVLLHLILAIGPLARLSILFKPLLYNRRHLGISLAIIATAHVLLASIWYHGYGVIPILESLLISNPNYTDPLRFPFEFYGAAAYLIILVMALTSHNFWQKFFTPPVWKLMHMCVYPAYILVLAHVLFGFIQTEGKSGDLYFLGAAGGTLALLHLGTGIKEWFADKRTQPRKDGWTRLCRATSIQNDHAKGFTLKNGDKIAVFRYNKKYIVAVANACAHQNGPLCEGRIINGRIVCPWHGYEYIPVNGRSPEPFTEKISTYKVRIRSGMVEVDNNPNPPGTRSKPAIIK